MFKEHVHNEKMFINIKKKGLANYKVVGRGDH